MYGACTAHGVDREHRTCHLFLMETALAILPEGVSLLQAIIVIITACMAAALTASLGLGGGMVLLAVMSAALPIVAVIPVHGVAQLGSNAGRALLQLRHVVWPIFLWFGLGGLLGTFLGGQVVVSMPVWFLKTAIACFILFSVWGPKFQIPSPGPRAFFLTGAVGAFLTLFFGATGPIAATMLARANLDRFATMATHGACMLAQHLMKVVTFGALGFAYAPWVPLIAMVLLAGFVGTLAGTRMLTHLPEAKFKAGFKLVITLIAFYLLVSAMIGPV